MSKLLSPFASPSARGGLLSGGFSPLLLPGLGAWYSAERGITADGSNLVSAVADLSGNGNNGSATTTMRPTLTTVNGKAALLFNGSANRLLVNSLSTLFAGLDSPFTVVGVRKLAAVGGASCILWAGNSGDFSSNYLWNYHDAGGVQAVLRKTGSEQDGILAATTDVAIGTWSYNGVGSTIYLNGALDGTANVPTASTNLSMNTAIIGARLGAGGTPSSYFNGHLFEFLVYNRALTSLEHTALHNHLKIKYGI